MGVRGLMRLARARAPRAVRHVPLAAYHHCTVAVDATLYAHRRVATTTVEESPGTYSNTNDDDDDDDGAPTMDVLLAMCAALDAHGVRAVYVFDGAATPAAKRDEQRARGRARRRAHANAQHLRAAVQLCDAVGRAWLPLCDVLCAAATATAAVTTCACSAPNDGDACASGSSDSGSSPPATSRGHPTSGGAANAPSWPLAARALVHCVRAQLETACGGHPLPRIVATALLGAWRGRQQCDHVAARLVHAVLGARHLWPASASPTTTPRTFTIGARTAHSADDDADALAYVHDAAAYRGREVERTAVVSGADALLAIAGQARAPVAVVNAMQRQRRARATTNDDDDDTTAQRRVRALLADAFARASIALCERNDEPHHRTLALVRRARAHLDVQLRRAETIDANAAHVSGRELRACRAELERRGYRTLVAEHEAEATCAQLCRAGTVRAVLSEDTDALAFGAPIVLRLWPLLRDAATGGAADLHVEEVRYDALLAALGIDDAAFVDLCVLCGCDFGAALPHATPERALDWLRAHGGRIEGVLAHLARVPGAAARHALDTYDYTAARAVLAHTRHATPHNLDVGNCVKTDRW